MQQDMLRDTTDFDPMMAIATVNKAPIKSGESLTSPEVIQGIMEAAKSNLQPYDIYAVRSTCMDERPRIGLKSGEPVVEPRPSAPGGSDIYGLAIAELTGGFNGSETPASERAKSVKRTLNLAGLKSGGHEKCAADDSFGVWVPIIASEAEAVATYAQGKFEEDGLEFDTNLMAEVIANAQKLADNGRYADWNEETYFEEVLGEEAGEAIERLADVTHQGILKIWVDIEGQTVDQSALNNEAFILDRPYMKKIESIMTSGPEATHLAALAPYARYAIVKAISFALPNPELHEGTIK